MKGVSLPDVNVLSNPSYGSVVSRPGGLLERLRTFCASGHHHFRADSVSLRDRTQFAPALGSGHRQVTDIYLLGLAKRMGGRLVTFDWTIPPGAIVGATLGTLLVIRPASEP